MARNAGFRTRSQIYVRNIEEQERALRDGAPEQFVVDAVEQDDFARMQLVRAGHSQHQRLLGLAARAIPLGQAPPYGSVLRNEAGGQHGAHGPQRILPGRALLPGPSQGVASQHPQAHGGQRQGVVHDVIPQRNYGTENHEIPGQEKTASHCFRRA